ncbi:hypothetical protein [Polaromonas sp.]|uniref:hypothetical protein n=1 Tax=Polaromonas sp. TaxID=1869339 RepID=UPI003263BBC9
MENTLKRELSPGVKQAVDRLYAVFSGYRAPSYCLDVCLACCMDEALEKEMRRLPLRQISAKHFYEYNGSAKDAPQPPDELKYLLPRMLELLANGAEVHHSTELYLDRLGNCEAGAFSAEEYAAIDAFALAYFADCLSRHPWQSGEGYGGDAAFEFLLMFAIGGIDLKPLLDYWLKDESTAATLYYVSAGFYEFWKDQRIRNAFAEDRPEFQEVMQTWLTDESHRQTFARRILKLEMNNLDQTPTCYYGSRITPQDMAETVFDLITY